MDETHAGSAGCVLTIKLNTMLTWKTFIVAAISDNANSFGLRGVVIIAQDGQSYQLGVSYINLPKKGQRLNARVNAHGKLVDIPSMSYEIPQQLKNAPASLAQSLFSEKKEAPHA